jgi:hypothetical protein
MIPEELPENLVKSGIPPGAEMDLLAWNAVDAVSVLEALRGTKIAVPSGDIYRSEYWGLVPIYEGWSCDRVSGETAADYAERSRAQAEGVIERPGDLQANRNFYAFHFSGQQDAA